MKYTALLAGLVLAASASNAQNMDNILTPRQLSLAKCASFEARGDMPNLEASIDEAFDNGVSVSELKEAFSQLYAYTGFPRSLNALGRLSAVIDARRADGKNIPEGKSWTRPAIWDDADKGLSVGTDVQTRLTGGNGFTYSFCPQVDFYLKSHLFGDIFAGDILSPADREIVTVAALYAMKGVDPQLASHKRGAVNMGNTTQQIEALCAFLDEVLPTESGWPKGAPNTGYAQYFTGNSYLAPIAPKNLADGESGVQGYSNVTFEPGCRNNWHIHHGAHQILICVSGKGWYQEWGKPAVELLPGDIIDVPEGVKHWHGAQKDSWFSHLATHFDISDTTSNEWLEPVSDKVYYNL